MEIRNIAIIAPVVAALPENPRFSADGSASLAALLSDTGKLEFSRPLSNAVSNNRNI
jgi:hypothetical protein